METEIPTIRIELPIKQTFDVDICITEIIQAVNDLPLTTKWNTIGSLLNNIDLETEDLNSGQKLIINNWLKTQLEKFK